MDSFFFQDSPHGFVKRYIFKHHCEAFVAKTQKAYYQTIIYDAFAGSGYYSSLPTYLPTERKQYGSPLNCLLVVIEYFQNRRITEMTSFNQTVDIQLIQIQGNVSMPEPDINVILNFSEADINNCLQLVKNILFILLNTIGTLFDLIHNQNGVITIQSNDARFPFCINIANTEFINVQPPERKPGRRLLTFIDPFGYDQIPMRHVQLFIGEHKEAFINIMTSFVNRFKNVEQNENAMCKLYGFSDEDRNQSLHKLRFDTNDGISRCLKIYEKELTKRAQSSFVLAFAIRNKRNVRLCHLTFITNHIKGFKSMKEAMNRGSQDPDSLSMSDYMVERKRMRNPLANNQDNNKVAAAIFARFQGRTVNISEIEAFIWFETPYVWRKKPLKILQKEPIHSPRLTAVVDQFERPPRIMYTYPDDTDWRLTFRIQ